MTVGSVGLTGRAAKAVAGGLSFEDQIFLTKHADEAEKLIKEIKSVSEVYNRAAARHGRADQIDKVLAEAEEAKTAAKEKIKAAEKKAEDIAASAKRTGDAAIKAAKSECGLERGKIKASRDRVLAREKAVAEKEQAIEPLHAEAKRVMAQATRMEENVGKAKTLYEGRVRRLEEALREALKEYD